MTGKVAYIMSRFPHLSETFILREMIAMESLGWEIKLYPLIIQQQAVIHKEAQPWLERVHRLPWLSLEMLVGNIQEITSRPRLYFSLLFQIIRENLRSPKFLILALILFPKAVLMARLFREENIQHIHAHYATHPTLVAWIINKLTGITYSVTVHAHDIFVERAMLTTKLSGSVKIVAISEYNKNFLIKNLGSWISRKTTIIRCGIDPALYASCKPAQGGNTAFEIISVGSLQPYKGYAYLIQACAILRDMGINFKCNIIGGGTLYSELIRIIRRSNLDDVVKLVGSKTQGDVARMLASADCYVQPSVITKSGKMEGIPVALMEAMACGVPVVATSISGIPELVKAGETGWLVPPGDAQELVKTIIQVYNNPNEAEARSRNARGLVYTEFELYSNARKLSQMFTQVICHSNRNKMDTGRILNGN